MDDKILNEIFYSEPYELEYHYTQGFKTTRSVFGNELYLYVPGMVHYDSNFLTTSNPFRFPAISITGRKCQLSCEHCKGKLLENMLSAETPQALVELCKEIKRRGGTDRKSVV